MQQLESLTREASTLARGAYPTIPITRASAHEAEVAEWFEAPLAFVLDPANQTAVQGEFRGQSRTFYQINWEGRRIWGATAAMLVNLSRRLR